VDLAESQVTRAVPAILGSPAFLRLWRTALAAANQQLLLVLRDRSHLLTVNGSALTVNVPMAASTLINAIRLPPQLGHLLPSADVALALTGLAAARRRRRALLGIAIPVAALGILGALGVRLLTRTGGCGRAGPWEAPRQLVTTGT
jgi:hypothetical protein